ncbi:hypothetical protein FN846DRAFT_411738 [Sphaerosporella brunnea]|uniref:Uncharacterized protein n=1 Tax=Sphaerosporella brunnea TaxID=1250544 RepID=A0A5J5EFK2_9PEZI|nr:hypothetical protein FN846DRAFT_411738 [Sphaerosporella brunnea]
MYLVHMYSNSPPLFAFCFLARRSSERYIVCRRVVSDDHARILHPPLLPKQQQQHASFWNCSPFSSFPPRAVCLKVLLDPGCLLRARPKTFKSGVAMRHGGTQLVRFRPLLVADNFGCIALTLTSDIHDSGPSTVGCAGSRFIESRISPAKPKETAAAPLGSSSKVLDSRLTEYLGTRFNPRQSDNLPATGQSFRNSNVSSRAFTW